MPDPVEGVGVLLTYFGLYVLLHNIFRYGILFMLGLDCMLFFHIED